jgi:hypothetical protein
MNLSVVYPDGVRGELLRVPNYDFGWQLLYHLKEPRRLPKGTVLRADGAFDNSASKRSNADPTAEVRWGDQSWEEMIVGFFVVAVPAGTDTRALFLPR